MSVLLSSHGEIGRHAGFKIRRSKERVGSNPTGSTTGHSVVVAHQVLSLRVWVRVPLPLPFEGREKG